MNLPQVIQLSQRPTPLGYLIIGGYAVAAHGFTRPTFDVDFLVRREDLEMWKARLAAAGLTLVSERSAFAQFSLPDSNEGLDLMLVDSQTFERMRTSAISVDFDGTAGQVVGLDHLLSLKLHVLRQALPHRTNRDAEDVEALLRRHGISLDSEHYRQIFLTYGSKEIDETSDGSSVTPEASVPPAHLDLPMDPDFRSPPPTVPLGVLMARSADLQRWFPNGIPTEAERLASKCDVVFRLH